MTAPAFLPEKGQPSGCPFCVQKEKTTSLILRNLTYIGQEQDDGSS